MTLPLAGASIVVTRPADDAKALVEAIRRHGGSAIRLPGLSLNADPGARRALDACAAASIWIFSSPAAVRFAWHAWPGLHVREGAIACAIGAGTARALARHGIRAVAPAARSDSEGVLDLRELAEVRGRRIALVGAPGGRGLLAPALRARGAEVEDVHVYMRGEPRITRRHLNALAYARDPLIALLSSEEALKNLMKRLPDAARARLRGGTLVVSSTRLAVAATAQGFDRILVAASALPPDLLAAAAQALADGRAGARS